MTQKNQTLENDQCSKQRCEKLATYRLESDHGVVATFCDDHAEKMARLDHWEPHSDGPTKRTATTEESDS